MSSFLTGTDSPAHLKGQLFSTLYVIAWDYFSISLLSALLCECTYMTEGDICATACMWKSENNVVSLVLSFHLYPESKVQAQIPRLAPQAS